MLDALDPLIRRTIGSEIDFSRLSDPGLWSVQVDRSQFQNAILNLVANARDAMPEGGALVVKTANIDITADDAARSAAMQPGPHVLVSVRDTGEGMAPHVAKEAFTPFFTTKEVGKGSGLGLSMVFGFVRQSGGHLEIDTQLGLGTEIRMFFPTDEQAA